MMNILRPRTKRRNSERWERNRVRLETVSMHNKLFDKKKAEPFDHTTRRSQHQMPKAERPEPTPQRVQSKATYEIGSKYRRAQTEIRIEKRRATEDRMKIHRARFAS